MFGKSTTSSPRSAVHLAISLQDDTTYTTGDEINGNVTIRPSGTTSFEKVSIELIGTARTTLPYLARNPGGNKMYTATQRFLNLSQPVLVHDETSKQSEDNEEYNIPFAFVVPNKLMPSACQHHVDSEDVRDEHRRLPPSFNDHTAAGKIEETPRSYPNEPASIRYEIVATVHGIATDSSAKNQQESIVRRQSLHILPRCTPRDSKLDCAEAQKSTISLGKTVGKRHGSLTMQIDKPIAFHQTSTGMHVLLRFDPSSSNTLPPKLRRLRSQLRTRTTVSYIPRTTLAHATTSSHNITETSDCRDLSLSSHCLSTVRWLRHDPQTYSYRSDSISDTSDSGSEISPSLAYKGNVYYTAQFPVPITLPDAFKSLGLSFHSCLISRTYALRVKLAVGPAIDGNNIELEVPVRSILNQAVNVAPQNHYERSFENALNDLDCAYLASTISAWPDDSLPDYSLRGQVGTTLRHRRI